MLEILPESEGDYLAIHMSGVVTDADFEPVIEDLEARLDPGRRYDVLSDWTGLESVERGARAATLWFLMSNRGIVRRLAIVADAQWDDEQPRLVDTFRRSEVRFFRTDDRDAAVTWAKHG